MNNDIPETTIRNSAILGLAMTLSLPVHAVTTFTVNSTADQIDDDTADGLCHTATNTCSLRAAIMQANLIGGPGVTIIVPADTFILTRPAAGGNGADNGDLNLTTPSTGNPTIDLIGAGADTTIIDANQIDRVFAIASGRTAAISGVSIRNGFLSGGTSAIGGGIDNHGTLAVTNSTLAGNQTTFGGGGIYNGGTLSVTNSTLSTNQAGSRGGGIYNAVSGTVTVTNSTLSSNQGLAGGGIFNDANGTVAVTNSTLSGNLTNFGGGIYNFRGTVQLRNSTLSDNRASFDGGGISSEGSAFIINSTLSGNTANRSGGGFYNAPNFATPVNANVYNSTIVFNVADADGDSVGIGAGVYNASGSTFNQRNSVVAGNSVGGTPTYNDCTGVIGIYGSNRFSNTDGCTAAPGSSGSASFIGSLAELGSLADNGGPTQTIALVPPSNLIDGGVVCADQSGNLIPTDQRGLARLVGAACDIGAFEYVLDPVFASSFE